MRQRQNIQVSFPLGGINESKAKKAQPEGTTADALNVRAFDITSGRSRGAQRSGLSKYTTDVVVSNKRVQDINHSVVTTTAASSMTAMGIRSVRGIAVCDGIVKKFTSAGVTALTTATASLSTTAPVIFSTQFFGGDIYFADGVNAKLYDQSADDVATWTASAGSLPKSGDNYPRLIETWRGRIVQSGIKSDPHNWFMSAVGDATDWDYAPATETETQAVAGNNAAAGQPPDTINCIIPYSDDVLLFGCDHSIWQLSGDPQAGGRLDLVSDVTGMAFGRPWCKSPEGNIYFYGSRGGVFVMAPSQTPQRLSAGRIEERLNHVDLNKTIVRLVWNDRELGVHVFLTRLDSMPSEHWFYDTRNDSWWRDRFTTVSMNPVAVHVMDGDDPADRTILIGSENGYIRKLNPDVFTDDGDAIESYVLLGPLQLDNGNIPFVISEVQGFLTASSANVDYVFYMGDSAESVAAFIAGGYLLREGGGKITLEDGTGSITLNSDQVLPDGTLSAVRSVVHYPRKRGYAAYLKVGNATSTQWWAMESMRLAICGIGTSRGRR